MIDKENKATKNYQTLLDTIFGSGITKVPLKGESNNVIGALAHNGDYDEFKDNFRKLLIDLKSKYNVNSIKQALVEVADSKNWEGAYAELVALSVLKNDYSGVIETDVTLKEGAGFAKECGQNFTNEDGYWKDYDVYFDVKILSDSIKEVIDGIIERAEKKAGVKGICNVLAEYPLDDEADEYIKDLAKIEQELVIGLKAKETAVRISIIPRLLFRIKWGSGVNSTISAYSPYRHAEHTKDIVLKRYAKKLLKSKPFFLVFVNFPWFKQIVNDFANMNEYYYRALSRRTFVQYEHSKDKASEIIRGYKGKDTKRHLARCLTGIIFIEDHSAKVDDKLYKTFVYLNPNAKNKAMNLRSYLDQLPNEMLEDFSNDNY
jgi:hypothetical protein